ncbi:ABC transporter permease [Staphylococcus succinus]|nr:carbohydrate ABC transporter permease [Staphylococcus succinus]MBU0438749.1 carbohydrate ABC transporter permease [Staphylococcus succinus]PKI21259.1 ABC transporter permease [Staphylococcus succinus]PTI49101.1 carbohydrate ABC transporter permease [Staphylococcus succinus]RIN27594.1 carbohydrate ABC transporter permease [Staphylococcus succinus]RIN37066.1 carbohydrate ABC transporter permease [Staphylococcus succinus]
MNITSKKNISNVFELLGIILIILFLFFPIVWIILTAFKSGDDVFSLKVIFTPTIENFKTILGSSYEFGAYYLNSIVVVFFTLIITMPLSLLAAYSLSRFEIIGKNLLLFMILSTQFIPLIINAIPFFTIFKNWGILDTPIALIIVNLGQTIPYAIWLIKEFIDGVPKGIEEAAEMDGASKFGVIWHVIIPIAKPGIITATVFCFVIVWNEFMFALILTNQKAVTLPVALSYFVGENGVIWNEMAAAGLLYAIPTIIFMLIVRKQFVKGMSAGAIK